MHLYLSSLGAYVVLEKYQGKNWDKWIVYRPFRGLGMGLGRMGKAKLLARPHALIIVPDLRCFSTSKALCAWCSWNENDRTH